jgi:hypothetical protein
MNYRTFELIKEELVNDQQFSFYMKGYEFGHNDVTFKMDKAMTFQQLKEILDKYDIEKKFDVDSFIDGNNFNGLKITYFYLRKR